MGGEITERDGRTLFTGGKFLLVSNSVLRHRNIAAAGELVPAARTAANSFSPPSDMSVRDDVCVSVRGKVVMWVLLQLVKMNTKKCGDVSTKKRYF